MEPLQDFLSLCIWTGAVAGERPVSAIVIAPPGAGKTSLLEMVQCDAAPIVSDITSREIHRILLENHAATHILLKDMMAIFGHKTSVVTLTLRSISSLTGEKMDTDPFSGAQLPNGGRMLGLITAIPTQDITQSRRIRTHLTEGGFASRFLLVKYEYKPSTVQKIHEYIASDAYTARVPNPFHVAKERKPVTLPPDLAHSVHSFALILRGSDPIGTRIHHHLRALTKAAARRAGRDTVTADDIQLIRSYEDFFSDKGKLL